MLFKANYHHGALIKKFLLFMTSNPVYRKRSHRTNRKKIFLAMKITTILLLSACLTASAGGHAQKVTLSAKNVKLEKIFKEIKKQTGYVFFYDANLLKGVKPVSIHVKNESIQDVLKESLEGKPLDFSIERKTIIIVQKEGSFLNKGLPEATSLSPYTILSPVLREIGGTVKDENGNPLTGVSVLVKGTIKGTSTATDGSFSIDANPGDVLEFSMVGYRKESVTVGNNQNITVIMEIEVTAGSEIVVVGYGTQKKANLTGAVTTVKMDEVLGDRPVSTVGALLQGAVPGLRVNIPKGDPGTDKSFNIRGATDIPATGPGHTISTSGPLILVDNVPLNAPLNTLDPNDIETVTVLKDAGSAAIYGARSAFGVILITTKKGTKNQKVTFNYSNNITISTPTNLPEKATVLQTIQSYKDMGTTGYWSGQNVDTWLDLAKKYYADPDKYPDGYALVNGIRYQLATTNAYKYLLGSNAKQYLNNFSVSGGSDKTTYRISFGTTNENGIIVPSSHQDYYKRYNAKSIITSDVNNWLNLQMDAAYSNATKSYPANAGFSTATVYAPYTSMSDSITYNGSTTLSRTPKNNVLLGSPTIDRFDDTRLTGRAVLKPVAGLTVTGEYTFDNLRNLNTSYDKISTTIDPRIFNPPGPLGSGAFRKTNENTDYHAINIYGNYLKNIQKHHFSLLAGFNQEDNSDEQEWVQRTQPISNELPSISESTGPITGDDSYSEYSIRGYFVRFNYDYDGKYLLEVNGRDDASSKFPENHRSSFFPSVSAGWAISKEKFMEPAGTWLSELKLRGSFGNVGNQSVDPYQFVPGLTSRYANWLNAASQVTTLNPPDLVSSNFTWATVQTADIGLDFGFLKNKLTGTFDIYQRDTKNLLYKGIQLPAVLGADAPLQNVAALRTKGYELQVNWRDKIGKVNYHITANLYNFVSMITKIQNQAGLLSQYYVGQKLGEIYGYVTDRLYTVDDFVAGTLTSNLTGGTLKPKIPKIEGSFPNPGDVLYTDLNGDGIINAGTSTLTNLGDRKIIGNNSPRYQFGISGGINYKNFDFSFVTIGIGKQDQFRDNVLSFPNEYSNGTLYAYQLDYWTPTNTNAFYGRTYDLAASNQPNNQRVQTKYLLNGAYFKITNLTLGYSLPNKLINKASIKRFQVFISVENAFTFDHLPKGSDPEINPSGTAGYDYPFMRMYSVGANIYF